MVLGVILGMVSSVVLSEAGSKAVEEASKLLALIWEIARGPKAAVGEKRCAGEGFSRAMAKGAAFSLVGRDFQNVEGESRFVGRCMDRV